MDLNFNPTTDILHPIYLRSQGVSLALKINYKKITLIKFNDFGNHQAQVSPLGNLVDRKKDENLYVVFNPKYAIKDTSYSS